MIYPNISGIYDKEIVFVHRHEYGFARSVPLMLFFSLVGFVGVCRVLGKRLGIKPKSVKLNALIKSSD